MAANERAIALVVLLTCACSGAGAVSGDDSDASTSHIGAPAPVVGAADGGEPEIDGGSADAAAPGLDATALDAAARPVTTSPSVDAFVASLAHGLEFDPLSAQESAAIGSAAVAAADGDAEAASLAASAGYELVTLQTASESFTVLRPTPAAPRGQATLVLRAGWARDLMIEAPHVPFDTGTDTEASIIFDRVGARAMLIAGAQRCCSTVPTNCWPNPQCEKSGASVESDPSHSIHSAFHAIHVALASGGRTTNAVQLHTNGEPKLNGVVLASNGIRAPSPRLAAFSSALAQAHQAVRSCDEPDAGNDTYCGTTNAQGLESNGQANACSGWAKTPSDRFLHLEQNADDLLQDAGAFSLRIADGIEAAFLK